MAIGREVDGRTMGAVAIRFMVLGAMKAEDDEARRGRRRDVYGDMVAIDSVQ